MQCMFLGRLPVFAITGCHEGIVTLVLLHGITVAVFGVLRLFVVVTVSLSS